MGWNELAPPPPTQTSTGPRITFGVRHPKSLSQSVAFVNINKAGCELFGWIGLDLFSVDVGHTDDAFKIRLKPTVTGKFKGEAKIRQSIRLRLGYLPGLRRGARNSEVVAFDIEHRDSGPDIVILTLPATAFDAAIATRHVGGRDNTASLQGDPTPGRSALDKKERAA